MLNEILKLSKIDVYKNGQKIDNLDIKNEICEVVTNCYLAPCMAMADNTQLDIARKKGTWIEIIFNEIQTYKDFDFEKLLINLYPKHDFLVMHRYVDDKYQGKSITINLMSKTTDLFKYIENFKVEKWKVNGIQNTN